MSILFSPYRLGDLTLRNRLVIPPMSQHMAIGGMPSRWHAAHLSQFALGGAGLILVESTAISECGLQATDDLGIWSDRHAEAFVPVVEQVHDCGAPIGIQLGHAGRKAGASAFWKQNRPLTLEEMAEHNPNWKRTSASSFALGQGWTAPEALTLEQIQEVKDQYRMAARRARQAGFDVIELHLAHGYLIASFLSPATNHREDEYGGDLAGRCRLALEVVGEVRKEWPAGKPLLCRISAVDGIEGGWSIEDSVGLSKALKAHGVDMIDCSSGGIGQSPTQASRGLGFQVPYAERIKQEADIPVIAVGYIVSPEQAEGVLAERKADLIAVGRVALFDPYWPLHAATSLLGPAAASRLWPEPYAKWLSVWNERLQEQGTAVRLMTGQV